MDLAYVWVTASDTTPNLPATLLPTNLTRVINDNSTVAGSGTANSLEYIVTTLNNTIQASTYCGHFDNIATCDDGHIITSSASGSWSS